MSKIEAVVFDVDGTLVDTSEFIVQAHEYALKHHNLSVRTREEIMSQVGKKLEDCYAFLAPGEDIERLMETHRGFQAENLSLVRPFEHAADILAHLRGQDIRLALFTSRKSVEPSLEISGVDPKLFEVILDANGVEKGKPDPEGLLSIMGKLGVTASSVVMVGDAAVDIQAGKNANVAATVGLTHGFGTQKELESAGADYILDSLESLPRLINEIE